MKIATLLENGSAFSYICNNMVIYHVASRNRITYVQFYLSRQAFPLRSPTTIFGIVTQYRTVNMLQQSYRQTEHQILPNTIHLNMNEEHLFFNNTWLVALGELVAVLNRLFITMKCFNNSQKLRITNLVFCNNNGSKKFGIKIRYPDNTSVVVTYTGVY